MKTCLAVICIAIIIISTCGCLWDEEKEKKEEYILEAVISVNKNVIYENDTITFNASLSKGDIVEYEWDFGDDETGEGEIVSHIYSEAGVYKVILKVMDTKNNVSHKQIFVYVNYYVTYSGSIDKDEKANYVFSVSSAAKKANVNLSYTPTYFGKIQIENLDLSVLAKWNNTYIYVKNSNNTNDGGKETVKINHQDILHHESGEWITEIYYNETSSLPSAGSVGYNLVIDVHYEPGYV